jgi:hypothetical protein
LYIVIAAASAEAILPLLSMSPYFLLVPGALLSKNVSYIPLPPPTRLDILLAKLGRFTLRSFRVTSSIIEVSDSIPETSSELPGNPLVFCPG